jgi:hypothetical protein
MGGFLQLTNPGENLRSICGLERCNPGTRIAAFFFRLSASKQVWWNPVIHSAAISRVEKARSPS